MHTFKPPYVLNGPLLDLKGGQAPGTVEIGGLDFDISFQKSDTFSRSVACRQQALRLVLAWNVHDPLAAALRALLTSHERGNVVDLELLNQARDALTAAGAR